MTTETGVFISAFAGFCRVRSLFDLDVQIFQVRASYDQKTLPPRGNGNLRGALRAFAQHGNRLWPPCAGERSDHPGSLGIAISEVVEIAAQRDDTKYALDLCSIMCCCTGIIGVEAMQQMEMADAWPDVVLSCTGGGSNFVGIAFPFIGHGLRGGPKPRIVAEI